MIKLIVGAKGSGKTKTLIDMIDQATRTSAGNIVVIEKSMKLTTEIYTLSLHDALPILVA